MTTNSNLILDSKGTQKITTKEKLKKDLNPKNLTEETKRNLDDTREVDKANYRQMIWKVQDEITQQANLWTKEALASKDDNYKRMMADKIKKAGEFCRALEDEITFLRNFK